MQQLSSLKNKENLLYFLLEVLFVDFSTEILFCSAYFKTAYLQITNIACVTWLKL